MTENGKRRQMRDKEIESLRIVLLYLKREKIEFEKKFPNVVGHSLWEHCSTLQEYLEGVK